MSDYEKMTGDKKISEIEDLVEIKGGEKVLVAYNGQNYVISVDRLINEGHLHKYQDLANLQELMNIIDAQYQLNRDATLPTVDKTITGSLKEIYQKVDSQESIVYDEDWYTPPEIKQTLLGEDGIPSSYSEDNYEGFYDWILNSLLSNHPKYVSKQIIGVDQSNQYNIYRYDFTPKNYSKTILICSCLHGNEYTSFFGLCRFLEQLCNNKEDRTLSYLRNNIKFVVVPICNPWGFINSKRQNVNKVDLNRNFDYRWNEYTTSKSKEGQAYYKGEAPFSEREAQLIRDLALSLKDDKLVAEVDFHTITTIQAEKILYYPRFHDNIISELSNVVEGFSYGENRVIFASSTVPTLSNYLSFTHGINAINPEWCNAVYGVGGTRDSTNMTKWVEWAGNLIRVIAQESTGVGIFKGGPFVKHLSFIANPSLSSDLDANRMCNKGYCIARSTQNKLNSMELSKFSFTISQQYVLQASGFIQVDVEKDAELYIQPLFYQKYAPEQNYSTLEDSVYNTSHISVKAGQTYFIPVQCVLQGFCSNYNNESSKRSSEINFRIRAYTDVISSCYISAYNISINGQPSDVGRSVEIYAIDETGTNLTFPLRVPEDIED